MNHVWLIVFVLMFAACGDRVRPSAPIPEPARVADERPTDQAAEPARDPEPEVSKGDSFRAEGRARQIPVGYSRELKLLYLEQRFRWQARALSGALKHDQGLAYQGFFFDAQDGWTQPTSIWSAEVKKRVKPLYWPIYDEDGVVGTEQGFIDLAYDVLLVGDVDTSSSPWSAEYWGWIENWVKRGGGLILLAGQLNNPGSYGDIEELHRMCPVSLELPEGHEEIVNRGVLKHWGLTPEGREHDLFRMTADDERDKELWGSEAEGKFTPGELQGLYWHSPNGGAVDGATVLARVAQEGHAIEDGDVLVATKPYGEGRVVWVGSDDTWLWREAVGDRYFYKFWQNAIRWATNDPGEQDD